MTNEIIVATIGAAATISAPIITLAVARYIEQKKYATGRLKNVQGVWEGHSTQSPSPQNGKGIIIAFKAALKVRGKIVEGTLAAVEARPEPNEKAYQFELKLTGHFPHEDYIVFTYQNGSSATKQFGACVLKLSASGKALSGEFVGFGDRNDAIVSGKLELTKTAASA